MILKFFWQESCFFMLGPLSNYPKYYLSTWLVLNNQTASLEKAFHLAGAMNSYFTNRKCREKKVIVSFIVMYFHIIWFVNLSSAIFQWDVRWVRKYGKVKNTVDFNQRSWFRDQAVRAQTSHVSTLGSSSLFCKMREFWPLLQLELFCEHLCVVQKKELHTLWQHMYAMFYQEHPCLFTGS